MPTRYLAGFVLCYNRLHAQMVASYQQHRISIEGSNDVESEGCNAAREGEAVIKDGQHRTGPELQIPRLSIEQAFLSLRPSESTSLDSLASSIVDIDDHELHWRLSSPMQLLVSSILFDSFFLWAFVYAIVLSVLLTFNVRVF